MHVQFCTPAQLRTCSCCTGDVSLETCSSFLQQPFCVLSRAPAEILARLASNCGIDCGSLQHHV